jgi:hypothetical protein
MLIYARLPTKTERLADALIGISQDTLGSPPRSQPGALRFPPNQLMFTTDKHNTMRGPYPKPAELEHYPFRQHGYFPMTIVRISAWIAIVAITIVSLVPASARPVSGASNSLEHLLVFGLAGLAFGFGYRVNYLRQMIGLVFFAGAIELSQYAAPGRHPRLIDFVVDAAMASSGVAVAWLFDRTATKRRLNNHATIASRR